MNGARLVLRGLADTYEHLIYFTLVTLLWWLCVFLIIPGPAASLVLLMHADPRIGTIKDRPNWSETLGLIRANLWRGWRLALITLPVLLLVIYNIGFYGGSSSALGLLAPLWFFLFLIGYLIALSAFSIAAILDEQSAWAATKLAFILVGARLPHGLLVLLGLAIVLLIGSVLVVPVIMFVPATFAATVNRFVLVGLRRAIPNSMEPTPERLAEGQKRKKWFGP
ncbi:MAG: hypothetical protein IT336_04765 [Thermomicrobiales bacterium]|nr:hypothetical protein [Thermomicrobiales bacterium]